MWAIILLLGSVAVAKHATTSWSIKVAGQWGPVMVMFGGRPAPPPPVADPPPLSALQSYLDAIGVHVYTAAELATPHHPAIARQYGYTWLVPPLRLFPAFGALSLAAQALALRARDGRPTVRNIFRPPAYNADPVVGGAGDSYHVIAAAADIDFDSVADRVRAESWLRTLYCKHRGLKLGLGIGRKTLHVDLLGSERRPAQWSYGGVDVSEGGIPCS